MQLFLYGHEGCYLCDRLAELIEPHVARLRDADQQVDLVKRDIAANPEWTEAYRYRIPVLTLNATVILEGRPEPDEISAAFDSLLQAQRAGET